MFTLNEIGAPCLGVLMYAVEMRLIPKPGALQIRWPFRIAEVAHGLKEGNLIVAGARRRGQGAERTQRFDDRVREVVKKP